MAVKAETLTKVLACLYVVLGVVLTCVGGHYKGLPFLIVGGLFLLAAAFGKSSEAWPGGKLMLAVMASFFFLAAGAAAMGFGGR